MRRRLGARGQKWLKACHILFGVSWTATGIAISALGLVAVPADPGALHGVDLARKFIDDFLVIPCAVGCLATSILYSSATGWGWFRHRFVTVKWIICVGGILFGTFWLGPWLNALPEISGVAGADALADPVYQEARRSNFVWGLVQNATLVFAVIISTLKPWSRAGRAS